MARFSAASMAAISVATCAACSTTTLSGQATISPSARGASPVPEVVVVLDGKSIPLKPGPTCIGDTKNILILARFEETEESKVTADIGITEPLTVHSVLIKSIGGQDYFWEATSIRPDALTATKSGRTVTVTGEISDRDLKMTDKKQVEIQAINCPGT